MINFLLIIHRYVLILWNVSILLLVEDEQWT